MKKALIKKKKGSKVGFLHSNPFFIHTNSRKKFEARKNHSISSRAAFSGALYPF